MPYQPLVVSRANDAWLALIRMICDLGAESRPRGLRIKELLCTTTVVDMRYPVVTIKARKIGYRFMVAEAWWILTGRNDVASMESYSPHIASFSDDGRYFFGAYGPRVVDQLTYVVDTLTNDPDSRQAVIEIWRQNPRPSRDVPCTLAAQWLIRDGKLHCVNTMRSSDAWLGICYDWFNFSMLSTYILLMLRYKTGHATELGALWLTAGSSHLYVDPKVDGANNIPYSLADAQRIVTSLELAHLAKIDYEPLDVDEFSSPDDFISHLEMLKDRKDSGHRWLRELLLKEEK